jgi:hypothetical protein
MAEAEAVAAKLPCKLFAEGFCPHGAACAFSHDTDPDQDSLETPLGCWSGAVQGPGNNKGDDIDELGAEFLGRHGLGLGHRWGHNVDLVEPESCALSANGGTFLHIHFQKSSQVVTHFSVLMPHSVSRPQDDYCFDSLALEWSQEHVANLFKGTEFSEFIEREGIDGYTLAEIVARKEAFEKLHSDWGFAKLCRLYKAITELTRKHDNEVIVLLPLAAEVDGMYWFKAKSKIFDRLAILYRFPGSCFSAHVHELRRVKLVSVAWSAEHEVRLTFRSRVLLTHFFASRDVARMADRSHVTSLPAASHIFCEALTKSFQYDLLKFSFTHERAMLLPQTLRLAYRELLSISKFRKDHPLARFDKNLVAHLFKFVCSSFEEFCPIPLATGELGYVAMQRKALGQVPLDGRNDPEPTGERRSKRKKTLQQHDSC